MKNTFHPQLNIAWARQELVPFFEDAYAAHDRYSSLTTAQWEECLAKASLNIDTITVYEDFDSTIERVRLMLIDSTIMTPAEIKDYGWIRDHPDICAAVFIRHAIRHDIFKCHSLGKGPSPDHPRRKDHDATYIYGDKFSARMPKPGVYERPPLVPNLTSGGHNNSFRGRHPDASIGGNGGRGGYSDFKNNNAFISQRGGQEGFGRGSQRGGFPRGRSTSSGWSVLRGGGTFNNHGMHTGGGTNIVTQNNYHHPPPQMDGGRDEYDGGYAYTASERSSDADGMPYGTPFVKGVITHYE
ncbi:hypothetical protein CC86DRAFT_385319 [Ophiobolus disseminans]|uniref:Uncharacterized protein n=1 Tax=Ophiobolus disseminans TaxID=1469910 RepID=A0A6A6ZQ05_9PLEO|nr:hypothetical protein CC86DRAFT_385319 [Ophiobolus disseminans]